MLYLYEAADGLALFKQKGEKITLIEHREFKDVSEALQHQGLERTHALKKLLKEVNPEKHLCVKSAELAEMLREKCGFQKAGVNGSFEELAEMQTLLQDLGLMPDAQKRQQLSHQMCRYALQLDSESLDLMIVEATNLLVQADKEINHLSVSLAEWVSWSFPESVRHLQGGVRLAKFHAVAGGSKRFYVTQEAEKHVREALGDDDLYEVLLKAGQTSTGTDLAREDTARITQLSQHILNVAAQKAELEKYVEARVVRVAPNLSNLLTPLIAARLLARAHSLRSLAKAPASTLQILGSELSLFNAQREGTEQSPKFGFIYSIVAQQAGSSSEMGRVARRLGCKAALAVRLDCFSQAKLSGQEHHLLKAVKLRSFIEQKAKEFEIKEQSPEEIDTLFLEGPIKRRQDKE